MQTPVERLKAEYEIRRERNPNLSLRAFARWLGISPAQISQILSGKRRLTPKLAAQLARRLDMSPFEKIEFIRHTNLDFIESSSTPTPTAKLSEERFQMIAEWYHMAILSLTRIKGAKSDPRWIAQRLGISVSEAQTALERLCKLNLLELKPFRQIGEPLLVASEVPSQAIRRHHKQLINMAIEKIDTETIDRRQIQSLTIATDAKHIALAQKRIERFLDEMNELMECPNPTDVYALNLQLSPLTKKENPK